MKERCKIQVLIKIQVNYEKVVCITVWILPVDIQRLNSQVRCTFSVRNMPLSQVLGNFNLLVSAPAFILYYLLYSTFDFNDPEGFVTDTTVNTCFKFKCQLRVRWDQKRLSYRWCALDIKLNMFNRKKANMFFRNMLWPLIKRNVSVFFIVFQILYKKKQNRLIFPYTTNGKIKWEVLWIPTL